MSEVEKEMAEAVLEAIDLRLKPIREELKALNESVMAHDENFNLAHNDVKRLVEFRKEFSAKFVELDEKFVVTARLIDNVIVFLEKRSGAKRSDDEVKGLKFLKGEPY